MQYVPTASEKRITATSAAFYGPVFAHAFKWKEAGRVNAIGVHAIAPKSDKNLSILSFSESVKTTVIITKVVLETFLNIILFLDLGHVGYK